MNALNNIINLSSKGKDSKYFTTTKKGEIFELKEELRNPDADKKRDAVKKVIAAMTVGKDVSMLFTDVVICMQTGNVELKKLVYLYLINYAKTNPDLAILAVNTFRRDASDSNPLIRALAIRTMGCIRVDKITEHLGEPLRNALKDDDPYVRKTAAICVAKLHDINPELADDQGFLDMLRGLVSDSNPAVVANAVAALMEINEKTDDQTFTITKSVLTKLLAALNECTEWGQVFILDALSTYEPEESREAESIIERVVPRLQHVNSAVVMSAVKVVVKYLDLIENEDTANTLSRKLAPPLVTLLSSEPEIQYVALRNINLIVQKRPMVLRNEIKVFFCKYNDPIYVKMEKLEIMIRLASDKNIEQVLLEFKEYATEVDVDFVRKSVRAIGRCAIKLERAAEKCINRLLDLIKTKVNYVVQESIIVIKDIFRKYPNRYESIIATLCENLDTLDEPEAKASMIWIIGEYAERIDNADELLESFLDNFHDETTEVKLQMLTATVKLFLKRPDNAKEIMENVLSLATEHSDDPDLRDRGYVYWRLLSSDPQAALAVVLGEKPAICDDTAQIDQALLDLLINNISTVSSIYHKPADAFVQKYIAPLGEEYDDDDDDDEDYDSDEDDDDDDNDNNAGKNQNGDSMDLLDFDFGGSPAPVKQESLDLPVALQADQGKGLQISAKFFRENGKIVLKMVFTNESCVSTLSKFAIQFNKNTFALTPGNSNIELDTALSQGSSCNYSLPVVINPKFSSKGAAPSLTIQVALKSFDTNEVVYFKLQLPFYVLFQESGKLDKKPFVDMWQSIGEANQLTETAVPKLPSIEEIKSTLDKNNIFHIATRNPNNSTTMYFSLKSSGNLMVLVEFTFSGSDASSADVCIRSKQPLVQPFALQAIKDLI